MANNLSKEADDCLVIVESKPHDSNEFESNSVSKSIQNHFYERYKTESEFFKGNDIFLSKTFPVIYREANISNVYHTIKKFQPDAIFVFGSSILKDKTLKLVEPGRFVNLHLGLSPYYRGSGTNFWPFVNNELEYVGVTILHLDPGIDTGDIITQLRPNFDKNDNVHSVGCKVIEKGTATLIQILNQLKEGKPLNRVKQWKISNEKYYRIKDFNEKAIEVYKKNLENKIVEKYISSPKKEIKLVELTF